MERRTFLKATGAAALAAHALPNLASGGENTVKGEFSISVAAWSWNNTFSRGEINQMDQIDLAKDAGASGLELVNSFFPSPQYTYLTDFRQKAEDTGIKVLLIMVDREGNMNAPNKRERKQAVINHRKWLDIAAVLGCHSIRCNSGYSNVSAEESMKYAAESFTELCEYAEQYDMNVLIENHGGHSSDAEWMVGLMEQVGLDNFGTLPDFGNFPDDVNRYEAVETMMPYAKAVSAKCSDFDEEGNDTKTDFNRMMKIVLGAGYHGYVGVEFEGGNMAEQEGVKAGVNLLKRFQA